MIECTDLKTRRESLWKLKTMKNKVAMSDIEYFVMISIDFEKHLPNILTILLIWLSSEIVEF